MKKKIIYKQQMKKKIIYKQQDCGMYTCDGCPFLDICYKEELLEKYPRK